MAGFIILLGLALLCAIPVGLLWSVLFIDRRRDMRRVRRFLKSIDDLADQRSQGDWPAIPVIDNPFHDHGDIR